MGERKGDRATIERVAKRIASDGVPLPQARKKAVESMKRVDRKLREQGKR